MAEARQEKLDKTMLKSFRFIHDRRSSDLRTDNESCW